jgi:hypothetical protein
VKLTIKSCSFNRGSSTETLLFKESLIKISSGGGEIEGCEIKDTVSGGGDGSAINGIINNNHELIVKDSVFSNCSVTGEGKKGGAIYCVVKRGGRVTINGKKSGSENTFIGCHSNNVGGGITISFEDDVIDDDCLVLSGILYYFHFIFIFIFFLFLFSIVLCFFLFQNRKSLLH